MSKKKTAAKYATLFALMLSPLALAFLVSWGGGGVQPTVESLSLMLLASAFVFPLLFSILGNERVDPGERYAIAVGLPLGMSLVLATIGLAFGIDSLFSAAVAVPFFALGAVMFSMAFISAGRYVGRRFSTVRIKRKSRIRKRRVIRG